VAALQPVNVRQFTRMVADTFAATARAKQVTLRVDVAANVPAAAMLDDVRMQQVLGNFLGTARGPFLQPPC
jgi:C4-dicarboxylate-specific signal transduction histidine kinase